MVECGGAMYYLKDGLGSYAGYKKIGSVLAVLFSCFCVLASFGIGNMSQINSIAVNMKASFSIPMWVTGVVLMDIYCLIFGGTASVTYLNLSLFLGYATMFPDSHFLLFFIIPIRAWIFALFDLVIVLLDLFTLPFPYNLFSIISLANYFLFFGKDVLNLIPMSWRIKLKRKTSHGSRPSASAQPKVIPFRQEAAQKPNYLLTGKAKSGSLRHLLFPGWLRL